MGCQTWLRGYFCLIPQIKVTKTLTFQRNITLQDSFENFGTNIKNTQTLFHLFYLLSNSSYLLVPVNISSLELV